MRPFVFFDRDGTVIVEKHYLHDPDAIELIEGAAPAMRSLREAGFGIALITNQAGVGRGYYETSDVEAVHARLRELLPPIDAIYYCPHAPSDECDCRKPKPGMLRTAALEHGVDLEASFIIGDKESDIDCGRNASVKTILVRTGYGRALEREVGPRADFVADSIVQAAEWILSRTSQHD